MAFHVEVVEHGDAHWPEVRALLGRVTMGGAANLTIQRAETRELAYLDLAGRSCDLLLRHDGQLVGFARGRVERRQLWMGDRLEPGEIALGGDLRIDPAARGKGGIRMLFETFREYAATQGWFQGWGLVNEGNERSYRLMTSDRHGQRSALVRTFTTASVLLWRRPRPSSEPVIEAFNPSDAELDVLPSLIAHRAFAPAPPTGTLPAIRRRFPEMRFYRRVSDQAFVTCLWNPERARQLRLHRLSPSMRAARALWNAARPLSGAAPFPGETEPLQSVELAFTVRERLSRAALRDLAVEAHSLGGHVLNVVVDGLAPREQLDVPGLATRLRTRMIAFATGGKNPCCAPPEVPVYLDLSIL